MRSGASVAGWGAAVGVTLTVGGDYNSALFYGSFGSMAGGALSRLLPCFPAGTPILIPGGHTPIERLKAGDLVLSRDERNVEGSVAAKVIEEAFQRQGMILELTVSGQTIRTTPEHPFYVRDKGWQPAGELTAGDMLSTETGTWIELESVVSTGEASVVYNFRVADWHTYFVGSPDWGFGVWVHNSYNSHNSPSQILSRNLLDAGVPITQAGSDAAHIVPHGAWTRLRPENRQLITDAQQIMKSKGININNAINGFRTTSSTHMGTHKIAFFQDLKRQLVSAQSGSAEDVAKMLIEIRKDILNGNYL